MDTLTDTPPRRGFLLPASPGNFPPTELERLQRAHRNAEQDRQRFTEERERALDIINGGSGDVIPRDVLEAHLASLWRYLFEEGDGAPRAAKHPSLLKEWA